MLHKATVPVVLLAIAGLGYAAWRVVQSRGQETCQACQRAVHHHTRTVGIAEGKREIFCCPACALSEHRQTGRQVRITELTDFESGTRFSPDHAYVVRGSDLNPCVQHTSTLDRDKQPLHVHFDRCSPSMLAFAHQEAAATFAKQHGGQVVRFQELASDYRN